MAGSGGGTGVGQMAGTGGGQNQLMSLLSRIGSYANGGQPATSAGYGAQQQPNQYGQQYGQAQQQYMQQRMPQQGAGLTGLQIGSGKWAQGQQAPQYGSQGTVPRVGMSTYNPGVSQQPQVYGDPPPQAGGFFTKPMQQEKPSTATSPGRSSIDLVPPQSAGSSGGTTGQENLPMIRVPGGDAEQRAAKMKAYGWLSGLGAAQAAANSGQGAQALFGQQDARMAQLDPAVLNAMNPADRQAFLQSAANRGRADYLPGGSQASSLGAADPNRERLAAQNAQMAQYRQEIDPTSGQYYLVGPDGQKNYIQEGVSPNGTHEMGAWKGAAPGSSQYAGSGGGANGAAAGRGNQLGLAPRQSTGTAQPSKQELYAQKQALRRLSIGPGGVPTIMYR